ncbi:MAG: hypothetical protein ACRCZD_13125, partial [Phycicoccus sp.]
MTAGVAGGLAGAGTASTARAHAPAPARAPLTAVAGERVYRSAIVRLGPELSILTATNHAVAGITGVDVDSDGYLVVTGDWAAGESILHVSADVDLT